MSAFAMAAAAVSSTAMSQSALSLKSGGRNISIERLDGLGSGARPAVLLLHGSDGLTSRLRYDVPARVLAAAGYTVFFPHYFDRTGELRASYGSIRSNFPVWLETVMDAATFMRDQSGIDNGRIGVLGASLGGALALSLASHDSDVAAVVSLFGFLPSGMSEGTGRAPTLILHGEADSVVPVTNAFAIERLLKDGGVETELKIYPGQDHGFAGVALQDAMARTVSFLNRYLPSRPLLP